MMGVLYNVVQVKASENVVDELKQLGITHTKDGTPINQLSYKEQVIQLAIARVKEVDVDHPNNKWF